MLELQNAYLTMRATAGWRDYEGRLLALLEAVERGILQGERSSQGEDLTPYLRFAREFLRQVLVLTDLPNQMAREDAETILGAAPGSGPVDPRPADERLEAPAVEERDEELEALARRLGV